MVAHTERCVKGSLFVPHLSVFQENFQLDVYQCIFQTQNSEGGAYVYFVGWRESQWKRARLSSLVKMFM